MKGFSQGFFFGPREVQRQAGDIEPDLVLVSELLLKTLKAVFMSSFSGTWGHLPIFGAFFRYLWMPMK